MTLRNWALRKPAIQSSTFIPVQSSSKTAYATKAVDGSVQTFSATNFEPRPWWMVDLRQLVLVYAIALKTMNDGLSVIFVVSSNISTIVIIIACSLVVIAWFCFVSNYVYLKHLNGRLTCL